MKYLGNKEILNNHKTAFLCSRRCPAEIVLKAYDWAIAMREAGKCVISGFHSPIEKDVLKYLFKGNQPLIIVLARGMKKRFKLELREAIEQGRLLVIALFDEKVKYVTEETAFTRNKYMLDLAEEIYVPYCTKGGLIEQAITSVGSKTGL